MAIRAGLNSCNIHIRKEAIMQNTDKKCSHSSGYWHTEHGNMVNEDGVVISGIPAIVIDTGTGSAMKCGDLSWIRDYYEGMCRKYRTNGFDRLADELRLISFDVQSEGPENGNCMLETDDACTIINWLLNCPGKERTDTLFRLSREDMMEQIRALQSYGF
jgi:hypothetical protein